MCYLTLCLLVNFPCFCRLLIFFSKSTFPKNSFRVSNSLDPDQAEHFVGPDLGPNSLQRLLADDTSRQRVNPFVGWTFIIGGKQGVTVKVDPFLADRVHHSVR